ncbi:MAG: FAD-binding protein [Bacteroidetes bacterium]|nr:FAD-binding protein [Bacteroidota bacterium]
MPQTLQVRVKPAEAADDLFLKKLISQQKGVPISNIQGFTILKKSIDARGRNTWVNLTLQAYINEPLGKRQLRTFSFEEVSQSTRQVIIIGTGPAGLFAALRLIEGGIKPILLERGKDVRARRRDLAAINREGIVNPDSNYCFGEGGAGTYSDGKLFTRSQKRGDVRRILELFVRFGTDESVLYESHPHIGTNKLPQVITQMRETILRAGGEIHFEQCINELKISGGKLTAVCTKQGDSFSGDAYILATGHSARDIFELLHRNQLTIEAKPFALGVRVEHPQLLIDRTQYHCETRDPFLPPAACNWVEQVNGKGVFSFCMCPGGIIAPAATAPGELVVNGWSPSKRNNPFANSGIVVSVELNDIKTMKNQRDPLSLMQFQQQVEQTAFKAGGGNLQAPAQRLVDFCENRTSTVLPSCSYLPGITSVNLKEVLPQFIHERLQLGFKQVAQKMKSYYTNEAVLVATESRTSSPVRIPRDNEKLHHPQLSTLYPCGEGAGYAGGILSAAMDGERIAIAILQQWGLTTTLPLSVPLM